MKRSHLLSICLLSLGLLAMAPPPERSRGGVVASDHELASEAGASVLAAGGNAVDAAVAAALSCGVVQPAGSGLGGGGFAIVVAGEERFVLDFREIAPAGSSADMFLGPDGEVVDGASTTGGLAVAVPGEGRGLVALHHRYGKLPLEAVVAPAMVQARDGFEVGEHLHEALARYPEVVPQLFDGVSEVPEVGQVVTRKALGETLKAYGETGGEALYTGDIAASVAAAVAGAGGVLTAADLAAYRPRERVALVGSYRDHTLITMPPPSSGGAVLLQVLAVMESWDLPALGQNSSAHLHLLAESMQHAYADRAAVMGDPDYTDVPLDQILSEARVREVREAFSPDRTLSREDYGADVAPVEDGGTQHIAVIDADGMAVSLTTTINTSFGSKVVDPESGLLMNNEMDDFVAKPGVPNSFGLIGRAANSVEPGKKPLSSMTPTVVLDPEGQVLMAVGASGGGFIISSTLQAISNVLDFGLDPAEAVSAPRMHHQWVPEKLFLDDIGHPLDVQRALEARGHTLSVFPFFSAVQLVMRQDGYTFGASDPRKAGEPAGQ